MKWITFFCFIFGAGIVLASSEPPLEIQEGDVISANVLNSLFARLNNATTGFQGESDLDGSWICTTYSTRSEGCAPDGPLLFKKTGTMTFDSGAGTFNYSGTGDPRGCFDGSYLAEGTYSVREGFLMTEYGVHGIQKRSSTEFLWEISNSFPTSGFTVCKKVDVPPVPVNRLTANTSDTGIELTWVDQSDTETGYVIERKAPEDESWVTLETLDEADVSNYQDVLTEAGVWQYRVFSTNAFGRSTTSSVVEAAFDGQQASP